MTELASQSKRLPNTTSQYIGLPKNISHSLGLPKKYLYFSHRLTEMNLCVNMACLYHISHINPFRNQLNLCTRGVSGGLSGVNCTIAKCIAIFSQVILICSTGEKQYVCMWCANHAHNHLKSRRKICPHRPYVWKPVNHVSQPSWA